MPRGAAVWVGRSVALCPTGPQRVAAALAACLPGQAACKHDSHWQGSHGAVESSRLAAWQGSESFIDHSTNIY